MFKKIGRALTVSAFSLIIAGAAGAQEKPKVAFVPQLIGIPYFNAMEAGGNKAAKELGVDFIYSGPVDTNPVDQLQIVQNLIDQGVGAISVSVLDASSIAPVVEAAKAKGIKLFTSDSDAPESGRAVYVAQATDEGLGSTIIDELVKRVGEDAKIGIVSGEATASNLNAWIGFMQKQASAKYPKLQLLEPQYAGGTAQRAAQISDRSYGRQSGPQGASSRLLRPPAPVSHRRSKLQARSDRLSVPAIAAPIPRGPTSRAVHSVSACCGILPNSDT